MEPMVLETITRILQRSVATMEHAAPYSNLEVEKMGLEPTALCLQSRCSTIELRPQQ